MLLVLNWHLPVRLTQFVYELSACRLCTVAQKAQINDTFVHVQCVGLIGLEQML